LPSAPIDHVAVARWLERTPSLRLDGERPTTKALATRLASYWLPDQTVVLVGSSKGSLRARIAAIQATPLGDPRPNARAYWLMTLRHIETSRVWWAATGAPEEHEDALLDAFAAGVSEASRAQVREPELILPFAVLGRPTGERRRHGLTGVLRPEASTNATMAPARAPTRRPTTVRRSQAADRPRSPRATRPAATPATKPTPQVDLTPEGLRQLEEELRDLREVRRPETVKRVTAARELGDLRENAEYHASREELGFIDGRIRLLESRLNNAVVFERPRIAAGAALGSVVVVDAGDGTHELRLVGSTESDPGTGKISTSSPVGRALLGRSAGEEVAVSTPAGERRYRIVEVR
jgi:transcription elongation factor GreA